MPGIPSVLIKPLLVIGKGIANITILQSERISKKIVEHEARKADVEINKAYEIANNQAIIDVKKSLLEKLTNASPEDRVRIRQDLEYLEKDVRQLNVYESAIDYLPKPSPDAPVDDESNKDDSTLSDSTEVWLDAFNDYARRKNEPWRADLLSRALALEATEPGSIGQRALWFIGTVDEQIFHAFAALLDISTQINFNYIVPNGGSFYADFIEVEGMRPDFALGNAVFMMSDLGLIGNIQSTFNEYNPNMFLHIKYFSKQEVATTISKVRINGIIYTSLGQTLSRLYEPKFSKLGEKIFDAFVAQLKTSSEYQVITPPSGQ